jgi:CubicO group peptidase (beta-lactamase class C family)
LSEPWNGSAPSRATDRSGRQARRRARPEAEALDSRLLMAAGSLAGADPTASPDLADRVAAALNPYFAQDEFPGVSVAIVTDGRVALAQGYGLANAATGAGAGANTRFDIGSVTKTFTALTVLLLYQDSQRTSHPLDLDAPIGDDLHDDKSFKLPHKWSRITTRELLAMTSGIRDVGEPRPWQTQLKTVANHRLLYAPGTASSYSNANYYLLGELIEQWTGESYGRFIQSSILGPLGMSATQELGHAATVPNQAVGYNAPKHGRWPRAQLQNGNEMYAAAGMVSTAQDMATYMTALLSGRLLDPATYAMMWTSAPTLPYRSAPGSNAVRGLGWDSVTGTSAGLAEVSKSGQVPGFTSELVLFPSSHSGVFVSLNTNHRGRGNASAITALQVAQSVYDATNNVPLTGM